MAQSVARWVAGLILFAALLGLGASWASSDTDRSAGSANLGAESAALLPVEVAEVHRVTSFDRALRYTGTVAARRTSDVGFARSARLVTMAVDDGDLVEAGQLLATLETRHLEARRQELEAQRAEASAILEELQAGPREQTIAAARAELSDLTAQVELHTLTNDRTRKLLDRSAASQQQLDDARFTLQATAARRDAATERLSELEAGTRQEQVTAQQAVVDRLDAELGDLAVDVDDSTLRAPFAGRIAARYLDEGTFVTAGQPVVRLVEHAALEARIGLPVNSAARLTPGKAVELAINARAWPAVVDRALPEVDLATRTRLVVFKLDSAAADSVVPGEIVRIEVQETTATDGFWLPTSALTPSTRGLWSVYAVVDGQVEPRNVEVLHTAAERVLVRGTLVDGDRVVTGGIQRVVPGQQVAVNSR